MHMFRDLANKAYFILPPQTMKTTSRNVYQKIDSTKAVLIEPDSQLQTVIEKPMEFREICPVIRLVI